MSDGCVSEMEICQGQKDLHAGFTGVEVQTGFAQCDEIVVLHQAA